MNCNERYDVLSPLRESFKGALFLARDKHTFDTVVLRVIYNAQAEHYRTLQNIQNPHLPRILEVMQDENDTLVAEEYIEGENLDGYVKRHGPLCVHDAVSVFTQLCDALDAIHSQGIIHRDIKPSNILLSGGRAVLIDFDASRQYRGGSGKDTVYMGTEGYAAPEQYGFAQTDCRSDIYSLGVVMRELCGEDARKALAPVIAWCTAFDPANRYAAAKQVSADLNRMFPEKSQAVQEAGFGLSANPSDVGSNTAGSFKSAVKVMLYVFFAIETIAVMTRCPHEVTVWDYILSKLVYLQIVIFPAAVIMGLLRMWTWLPLLNSKKTEIRILGVIVYCLLFFAVTSVFNVIAYAFYSPEALSIINSGT